MVKERTLVGVPYIKCLAEDINNADGTLAAIGVVVELADKEKNAVKKEKTAPVQEIDTVELANGARKFVKLLQDDNLTEIEKVENNIHKTQDAGEKVSRVVINDNDYEIG